MDEIWTIDDLAAFLKMSKGQIYTMTRNRAQAQPNAVPVLKLNGNVRFRKSAILEWLDRCGGGGK